MLHIESRPSKEDQQQHDFLINLKDEDNLEDVCQKIMSNLKPVVDNVSKHGGENGNYTLLLLG